MQLTGVARVAAQVARFMRGQTALDCKSQKFHIPDIKTWKCVRCGEVAWVHQAPKMLQ
jgi:hypothetical protein